VHFQLLELPSYHHMFSVYARADVSSQPGFRSRFQALEDGNEFISFGCPSLLIA
jgi:hypothetical protein